MTLDAIDESQRKAAKVAGSMFLFAIAIVIIANYGISFRLIIPGNAAETARNVMAHETLFRINIVCNLIYSIAIGVLLAALYVILKPVDKTLALVAAFCRGALAILWVMSALNSLGAVRLLGNAAYLPVFGPDQLQTLARLHIAGSYDAYYVGLPFWGLASTVCSCLLFKSKYIPGMLSAFGVISSAWCVICAFAYLMFPGFANAVDLSWFDVPMVLFEVATGFWLLFKGLRPSGLDGSDQTGDRVRGIVA